MKLRDMTVADLELVQSIEQQVHAHPWTLGNFRDALASGYVCKVASIEAELIGYAVLMPGVEEAELLTMGVATRYQRRGVGRAVLAEMVALARELGRRRVVLEVRVSNAAAIALYQVSGFSKIGLRRDYYPVNNGREDALVMELTW